MNSLYFQTLIFYQKLKLNMSLYTLKVITKNQFDLFSHISYQLHVSYFIKFQIIHPFCLCNKLAVQF